MDDVERLLKGTVEELDRLLNAKNVLAAPIEKDGETIIPLVSYGFGFGAAGGNDPRKGHGGGSGAGGGIRPVGAIVIGTGGTRVEGLKSSMTNLVEAVADAVVHARDKGDGQDTGSAG